jgi:putative endonuclease
MTNHPPSHYLDIGALGEDLVAKWLAESGWNILHRRWRCRLGEIDIIAEGGIRVKGEERKEEDRGVGEVKNVNFSSNTPSTSPTPYSPLPTPTLLFVEVKTRSAGSWDAGGRDALAFRKQQKIWRTAQVFLAKYPQKADYTCRFDVAIVFSQKISKKVGVTESQSLAAITVSGYHLMLQEYIPAAFDSL